jgi:hypothetical protein
MTPEASPYLLLFALFNTSSFVSYFNTTITGPKIYSWAIFMLSETFVNKVGCIKNPLLPNGFPPIYNFAPCFIPESI